MDRHLLLDPPALGVLAGLPQVPVHAVDALDEDLSGAGVHPQHLAGLALVVTGDDDHRIAFSHVPCHSQTTSAASETIFMKFFSRNSRATAPKMRVPRGLPSLSIITAAERSKRT